MCALEAMPGHEVGICHWTRDLCFIQAVHTAAFTTSGLPNMQGVFRNTASGIVLLSLFSRSVYVTWRPQPVSPVQGEDARIHPLPHGSVPCAFPLPHAPGHLHAVLLQLLAAWIAGSDVR